MNQSVVNIYLLRGLTRESGHWGAFVEMLQREMPQAKIHLLDLPGSGKYVHKKASSQISKMVDFMRVDFLRNVNTREGEHIICATSLAGLVACEWVTRYPTDFQGLIMISASFKKICSISERVMPQVRMDMVRILFARSIEKREALIVKVNSNRPELHRQLTKEWVKIQKQRTMSRMNILRQTVAGMRYNIKDKRPQVPLLIIGSKGDQMVCPTCIEKTHRRFGGTLIWHLDSGHGIPLDEPQWLAVQIADWVQTAYEQEREQYVKKYAL